MVIICTIKKIYNGGLKDYIYYNGDDCVLSYGFLRIYYKFRSEKDRYN